MMLARLPVAGAALAALIALPAAASAQELEVASFTATTVKSTVTYAMKVCNRSRTPARGVTLALYLHRTTAPTCATRGDLSGVIDLAAGACASFKVAGPLPDGVYASWLFIDATCRYRELNEKTNVKAAKFIIRTGADLYVKSATASGVAGGVILKGTVCANKVQARPFSVGVWLNKKAPTCADKPDISAEVDLPAGTCASFSEGFPQKPGSYNLSLMLDNTCLVPETSETNNTGGGPYTVPGRTCRNNGDCDRSQYCALRLGCTGPGTCKTRPHICTKIYRPVCGCDGKTYGNACMAAAAGVSVRSNGVCPKLTCKEIESRYTRAVTAAKKCSSILTVLQCTAKVQALLSCSCQTYVNPANTRALAEMKRWAAMWKAQACKPSFVCRCALVKGARCTAGAGSPGDACKDFYR